MRRGSGTTSSGKAEQSRAAGLMGNLFAESGLSPKNLQNTYEKKLGFTDDSYTAAVDSGSYQNFVRDSADRPRAVDVLEQKTEYA